MKNIILIGMPGAGKSTIGKILAKELQMTFVDSDALLEEKYGKKLCEIISEVGEEQFLQYENLLLQELQVENTIVATGGSAIYGKEAMAHLKSIGLVLYLKAPLPSISSRVGDLQSRGVVMHGNKDLQDMYDERTRLYTYYADVVADLKTSILKREAKRIEEQLLACL